MKKCKICLQTKKIEEFNNNGKYKHSFCRTCSNLKSKEFYYNNKQSVKKSASRYRKIIASIIDGIKEKYGCFCCKEKDPSCLDFHHILNKNNEVSRLVSFKDKEKIFEEINKCIVVCSNCHRKIHMNKIQLTDVILCKENINDYFEKRCTLWYTKDRTKFNKRKDKIIKLCKVCNIAIHTKSTHCKSCSPETPRKFAWPSKEELELLVWQLPTTKIAKMYGVSDVCISKLCKKMHINKPSRGYWTNRIKK